MDNSFAVIGLGKFGRSVAIELTNTGADVLAIDIDKERVHSVADFVTCAVAVDVRDTEAMDTLGLSNMDAVVIAITGKLDIEVFSPQFMLKMQVLVLFVSTGMKLTKSLKNLVQTRQ